MDPKLYHYLRYKVTHSDSAMVADVTTKLIMSMFDVPWEMDFASDQEYTDYVFFFEEKVTFDIEAQIDEWDADLHIYPTLWLRDEDTFSKLLYTLRVKFAKDGSKNENLLYYSSLKMLYYASFFYKCGLSKAPIIAFIEVYRLTCNYHEVALWF